MHLIYNSAENYFRLSLGESTCIFVYQGLPAGNWEMENAHKICVLLSLDETEAAIYQADEMLLIKT